MSERPLLDPRRSPLVTAADRALAQVLIERKVLTSSEASRYMTRALAERSQGRACGFLEVLVKEWQASQSLERLEEAWRAARHPNGPVAPEWWVGVRLGPWTLLGPPDYRDLSPASDGERQAEVEVSFELSPFYWRTAERLSPSRREALGVLDLSRPDELPSYLATRPLQSAELPADSLPARDAAKELLPFANELAHHAREGTLVLTPYFQDLARRANGDLTIKPRPLLVTSRFERKEEGWAPPFDDPGIFIRGAPDLFPPELGRVRRLDERAPVYLLGSVLYRLLTGVGPLKGFETLEVLSAKAAQKIQPAEERVPGLDPRAATILSGCLQLERELRYPDLTALLEELERLLRDEKVEGGPPLPPPEPARRPSLWDRLRGRS